MGQLEILNILKKNENDWFNTTELSKLCKINESTVSTRMRSLRDSDSVYYRSVKTPTGRKRRFCYKYKNE